MRQIFGEIPLVDLHETTPYKRPHPQDLGLLPTATVALDKLLFAAGNGVVT
jgi:hypothetical protein